MTELSLKEERSMARSGVEKRYNYLNITPLHSIDEDEETEFNSIGKFTFSFTFTFNFTLTSLSLSP